MSHLYWHRGDDYKSGIGTFAAVRYNTDGVLDTSFGTGGKVTTSISSQNDTATSVALQADGKIIVVGYTFSSTGVSTFAIVRYNTDGSLDTSFGTSGKVTTTIGSNNDHASSVAIQSDGKIVVVGNVTIWKDSSQYIYFAIVRYNTDGNLDTSFGSGGKVSTTVGSNIDTASSVVIQTDGRIVIVGTSNRDFAAVRFNTDGSFDSSFGTGGKVTTAIAGSSDDFGLSITLQADGKIIVAGQASDTKYGYLALVRYNTDGSLDTSFGAGGRIATPLDSSSRYYSESDINLIGLKVYPHPVAIQPDGKIIVAGPAFSGTGQGFTIVRYVP